LVDGYTSNLSFLVYLLEIQGIFLDEFRIFFSKIRVYPLFEKKNAKMTRKKSELQERNPKLRLVLFISAIVHHFSQLFMAGDRNYRRYFLFLSLISISTLLMLASDNIVILIAFWSLSNLILVFLMMHKFQWAAAKNSGILAIKTFVLGLFFLL
jgi:hypothetical protein